MQAIFAAVLVLAVAVNGGVYTATSQIHGVALSSPVYHAAPIVHSAPLLTPAVHTASSSSYKYRAPAAKILTTQVLSSTVYHAAPVHTISAPVYHTMSHGVLLH